MNITDLFKNLSYGELSNLKIGMEGAGDIEETKKPKIVHYANNALMRLYSKFLLKEADLIIEQAAHIMYYKLDSAYNYTAEDPPALQRQYIRDHPDRPYRDDAIKILRVVDIHGSTLPLNDHDRSDSVFTPQPTVLQVPYPIEMEPLGILYQARHVPLVYTAPDTRIDVPPSLEKALTSYIAYETFSHMNGPEHAAKAKEHLTIFNEICGEVSEKDLVSTNISSTLTKFDKRGFI